VIESFQEAGWTFLLEQLLGQRTILKLAAEEQEKSNNDYSKC
jgi:hypothetical protein